MSKSCEKCGKEKPKKKQLSKEELAERKERKKGFFLFHKEVFLMLLSHALGMLSSLIIYAAANGVSIWEVFK